MKAGIGLQSTFSPSDLLTNSVGQFTYCISRGESETSQNNKTIIALILIPEHLIDSPVR